MQSCFKTMFIFNKIHLPSFNITSICLSLPANVWAKSCIAVTTSTLLFLITQVISNRHILKATKAFPWCHPFNWGDKLKIWRARPIHTYADHILQPPYVASHCFAKSRHQPWATLATTANFWVHDVLQQFAVAHCCHSWPCWHSVCHYYLILVMCHYHHELNL
jgi:hypothetical protein